MWKHLDRCIRIHSALVHLQRNPPMFNTVSLNTVCIRSNLPDGFGAGFLVYKWPTIFTITKRSSKSRMVIKTRHIFPSITPRLCPRADQLCLISNLSRWMARRFANGHPLSSHSLSSPFKTWPHLSCVINSWAFTVDGKKTFPTGQAFHTLLMHRLVENEAHFFEQRFRV